MEDFKGMLIAEIAFINALQSIYTLYPEGYDEIYNNSKKEIERLIKLING